MEWIKQHKVITVVIVIAALAVIGSFLPDAAPQQPAASEQKQAAPADEKEKKWTKVTTLSGSTNKRSQNFALSGGETRLKYTLKGGEFATASIYVVPKGQSLDKEGGFPEAAPDKTGSDTTMIVKSAGEYYLDVSSANASWTVTIEELK